MWSRILKYPGFEDNYGKIRGMNLKMLACIFQLSAAMVASLTSLLSCISTNRYSGRPLASKDGPPGRKIYVNSVGVISTVAVPWIRVCESTHQACQQIKRSSFLTRVWKVGGAGEDVVLIDLQRLAENNM